MGKDYYKILGVSRNSSKDEIRRAFKQQARKYHPDVNPGDKKAEERFKDMSEAYNVLSDPKKKQQYDSFGSINFDGFPGYNPFEGPKVRYTQSADFGDLGDILGDLFGAAGAGVKGGRRRRTGFGGFEDPSVAAQKGRDLHFSIELDFIDSVKGCQKKIRLPNGVRLNVKIPVGVFDGSKIRLVGKGEPGLHGGPAGDLYIEPRIKDHPYFRRQDLDIHLNLPITLLEAIDGAKFEVPTIDGMVNLTIPPGAQGGQILRLRERGISDGKTHQRGDQYVHLEIRIPSGINSDIKEALKGLYRQGVSNPRSKLWL